jgi:glycosyltransferase involved in cell wall biosynthesis
MLMEKAVIVNKVPGIIDYVDDGNNVMLTEYKSESDLLSNIKYLLDNPSEINRISKNARNTVLNNFTEKNMSEQIFKFSINQLEQKIINS